MSHARRNKKNAQHSTGPKSEAGKQISAMNACRHGLTGQVVVMPNEDRAAYQRHLKSFTGDLAPVGPIETHLVQLLADTTWRLNRASALETNALNLHATGDSVIDVLSLAASLESQAKILANLSIYTQRLTRQFERAITQLRDLQKSRRAEEKSALDQLLDIQQMHEAEGEPYDPASDGFVFTTAQIHSAALARNRAQKAQQAYEYCLEASA